jgi:hypothetical protein
MEEYENGIHTVEIHIHPGDSLAQWIRLQNWRRSVTGPICSHQFRSKIRQLQGEQRQDITRHNQQFHKDKDSFRNINSMICHHNREVACHNSRRRSALHR